jgi:hypothetical protein
MHDVERHVWPGASNDAARSDHQGAQLVQAAKILGVTPTTCWRIRWGNNTGLKRCEAQ